MTCALVRGPVVVDRDGFLRFTMDVEPRNLRINLRYKHGHNLPPVVRDAMTQVRLASRCVADSIGWHPGNEYLELHLRFVVNTRQIDIDAAHKRTQDALADGMGFNDNRIGRVVLDRLIDQDERIEVAIRRLRAEPGEKLPQNWGGKEPEWAWDEGENDE